jgi:hypothetical protein
MEMLVQLSLTMWQERTLKRLVRRRRIDHHIVDDIESGDGIDVKVLDLTFERGFFLYSFDSSD